VPARKRRPKIAPTPFEQVRALGAALMFAALLAALARRFGDWGRIPALIWFHLARSAAGCWADHLPTLCYEPGRRRKFMHAPLFAAAAASLALTGAEPVRDVEPSASTAPARVIHPAPTADDGGKCPALNRHARDTERGRHLWRHYDRTRAGDVYLAVDRRVGGCSVPVLAGQGRRR